MPKERYYSFLQRVALFGSLEPLECCHTLYNGGHDTGHTLRRNGRTAF